MSAYACCPRNAYSLADRPHIQSSSDREGWRVLSKTNDVGIVTQGHRLPDHQSLHIGGGAPLSRRCACGVAGRFMTCRGRAPIGGSCPHFPSPRWGAGVHQVLPISGTQHAQAFLSCSHIRPLHPLLQNGGPGGGGGSGQPHQEKFPQEKMSFINRYWGPILGGALCRLSLFNTARGRGGGESSGRAGGPSSFSCQSF